MCCIIGSKEGTLTEMRRIKYTTVGNSILYSKMLQFFQENLFCFEAYDFMYLQAIGFKCLIYL
jgi:hypothetical protein